MTRKRCKHASTLSVPKLHGRLLALRNSSGTACSAGEYRCLLCLEAFVSAQQHHRGQHSHALFAVDWASDCDLAVASPKTVRLFCAPCGRELEERDYADNGQWAELQRCLRETPPRLPAASRDSTDAAAVATARSGLRGRAARRAAESVPSPERGAEPRGLPNYGNTCYQNAALQALGAVNSRVPLRPLSEALSAFFDGPTGVRRVYDEFTRVLFSDSNEQEDSHEFLRLAIDAGGMSEAFSGTKETRVQCLQCGSWEDAVRQTFIDLSLSTRDDGAEGIVDGMQSMSLSSSEIGRMLRRHLSPASVVDFKHCRGAAPCPASMHTEVLCWPQVLVLHLQRFANTSRKRKSVWSKDCRPIEPAMQLAVGGLAAASYSLAACIVHEGRSMDSGHYTAYVRHGRHWYYCSDERVRRVDCCVYCTADGAQDCCCLDACNADQAYVLLYTASGTGERQPA